MSLDSHKKDRRMKILEKIIFGHYFKGDISTEYSIPLEPRIDLVVKVREVANIVPDKNSFIKPIYDKIVSLGEASPFIIVENYSVKIDEHELIRIYALHSLLLYQENTLRFPEIIPVIIAKGLSKNAIRRLRDKGFSVSFNKISNGIYKLSLFHIDIIVVLFPELDYISDNLPLIVFKNDINALKAVIDLMNIYLEGESILYDILLSIFNEVFTMAQTVKNSSWLEEAIRYRDNIISKYVDMGLIDRVITLYGADIVAKSVGPEKLIEKLGIDKFIDLVGIDKAIELIGAEKLIEKLGIDKFIDLVGIDRAIKIPEIREIIKNDKIIKQKIKEHFKRILDLVE